MKNGALRREACYFMGMLNVRCMLNMQIKESKLQGEAEDCW